MMFKLNSDVLIYGCMNICQRRGTQWELSGSLVGFERGPDIVHFLTMRKGQEDSLYSWPEMKEGTP